MLKRILFFAYGSISYLIFLGTFLYAIGFIGNFGVPRTLDGAATEPLAKALAINVGLLALFAVQHSVMARKWFKELRTRVVPPPIAHSMRVTFCRPTIREVVMNIISLKSVVSIPVAVAIATLLAAPVARGDETCNSPYIAKLIKGQEDYVYVWTLGVEGLGDGSDKLVTVDVDPKSKSYGKILNQVSVGTRGEAHHMGFTDDRRRIWAGGLAGSDIYVFDIATDPARPKLVKTIKDLAAKTGFIGPHTYYALPGRMLVQALSNDKDKGGVTGIASYNNEGDFIARYPMPVDNGGDGYGYDLAVNPTKNVLLTSSFTGHANYMRPLGELMKDEAAMKRFGNTMVAWDLKAMKPKTVMQVPGAPLEIRWSLNPGDDWAVTATALTSKLWLVRPDASGQWQAKEVATIGDPSKIPLPVDISIRRDGKGLWVNTFMDGMTRYFDLTNPQAPKQTYEKHTGRQVNMISQSWDGRRVYITSSLLANWDKAGADNEQFLRGFQWDGKELRPVFEVDFTKEKLGRAHHMKLGSKVLRTAFVAPGAR